VHQDSSNWKWLSQQGVQLSNLTTDRGSMECQLPFLDIVWAEQELEWGSSIWASANNALRTTVLDAVHQTFGSDKYLSMIKLMYNKAFQAEDPLKTQRFSSLHHLLENELLPAVVSQALASCKPVLTDMVHSLFNQHCHEVMPPGAFTELDGRMCGCFTQQIQAHLASLAKPGMVPFTFTLTEDDSTSAARAALLDKLKQLRAALQTISQIAGVPVPGSNAFMTHTGKTQLPPDTDTDKSLLETGSGPFNAGCGYHFKWPVSQAKQDPIPSENPSLAGVTDRSTDELTLRIKQSWQKIRNQTANPKATDKSMFAFEHLPSEQFSQKTKNQTKKPSLAGATGKGIDDFEQLCSKQSRQGNRNQMKKMRQARSNAYWKQPFGDGE